MHTPLIPKLEGYFIFDPNNGKYSRGGSGTYSLWGKKPKIWSGMGPLKNHLNLLLVRDHYDEIMIYNYYRQAVVYSIATGLPDPFDIYAYIDKYVQEHIKSRGKPVKVEYQL